MDPTPHLNEALDARLVVLNQELTELERLYNDALLELHDAPDDGEIEAGVIRMHAAVEAKRASIGRHVMAAQRAEARARAADSAQALAAAKAEVGDAIKLAETDLIATATEVDAAIETLRRSTTRFLDAIVSVEQKARAGLDPFAATREQRNGLVRLVTEFAGGAAVLELAHVFKVDRHGDGKWPRGVVKHRAERAAERLKAAAMAAIEASEAEPRQ
jgi:hypothetical protein